jgi:hypothetical protein
MRANLYAIGSAHARISKALSAARPAKHGREILGAVDWVSAMAQLHQAIHYRPMACALQLWRQWEPLVCAIDPLQHGDQVPGVAAGSPVPACRAVRHS